jgi:hypothetical protein
LCCAAVSDSSGPRAVTSADELHLIVGQRLARYGRRDAILVVLPSSAEPALARLALAGAAALAPAAAVTLALDPVQRALALAGARAPRALLAAVDELTPRMRGRVVG